jgi:hypothetical protein
MRSLSEIHVGVVSVRPAYFTSKTTDLISMKFGIVVYIELQKINIIFRLYLLNI